MVDIFARLEKNAGGPIGQYMAYAHGYYAFPKLEGEIGPHMTFRGKKMLNWSLNNYLGLANHPEVRKADAEGAAQFGIFFTDAESVTCYQDVMACDVERFKRFFHMMLDEGVYLAPSAFEAGFMSVAHSMEDINNTIDAARRVFAKL